MLGGCLIATPPTGTTPVVMSATRISGEHGKEEDKKGEQDKTGDG